MPSPRRATIREIVPSRAVDGRATIERPVRRHQRGAGERALPADRPDVAAGRRLAVDLAGEVDLDRRVDGVQRSERGRARGASWVYVDRPHRQRRVVVGPVVEAGRAEQRAGHADAGVDLLALVRDDAGLDEVDEGVADEAGVDAEVAAVVEAGEHGVGRAADAELDRGAVGDRASATCAAMTSSSGSGARRSTVDQRAVVVDDGREPIGGHDGVAERVRARAG